MALFVWRSGDRARKEHILTCMWISDRTSLKTCLLIYDMYRYKFHILFKC